MFNNILKQLRKQHHMTQGDLSVILKVSRSTISMYELGERMPDHDTMKQIAELFNVSMDFLYGKESPTDDGELSENKRKLIEWARTVPDEKVEPILQALQSILAALQ